MSKVSGNYLYHNLLHLLMGVGHQNHNSGILSDIEL